MWDALSAEAPNPRYTAQPKLSCLCLYICHYNIVSACFLPKAAVARTLANGLRAHGDPDLKVWCNSFGAWPKIIHLCALCAYTDQLLPH